MKRSILLVSIVAASGVLFTNVYTSVVDARSWGSDIPNSIVAARGYFKAVNPGDFFRFVSPLVQLLSLASLVAFWRSFRALRIPLAAAVACFVLTDVMTFAYFYPRNALMFQQAPLTDVMGLTTTWSQWSTMNWVRSLLYLLGVSLSCLSLHRSYGPQVEARELSASAALAA
jgi:hypothetical protein